MRLIAKTFVVEVRSENMTDAKLEALMVACQDIFDDVQEIVRRRVARTEPVLLSLKIEE